MVGKRSLKTTVCLVFLLLPFIISAVASATPEKVVDQAGVWSDSERAILSSEADRMGQTYQMDIVLVTTDDAGGKTPRDYADDYFDQNGYGVGPDASGILLLLDFDNREVYISTSGEAIRYMTDARIESVLDAVFDGGMLESRYFDAAGSFLRETESFLQAGIPEDQYTETEGQRILTWAEGLVGLLISGTAGTGFFVSTRKRYQAKTRPAVFDFRQNSIAQLIPYEDNLVNTFVTTRIRPPVNPTGGGGLSGSGRSTVHRSGSGRMHGGGGRRF